MRLTVTVSDDNKRKVLELAKKTFEEKHKGTIVEIEPLPREILEQRVLAGNAPDLIEWDGSNIGSLLDRMDTAFPRIAKMSS